jgi:hypothetical protein
VSVGGGERGRVEVVHRSENKRASVPRESDAET